MFRRFFILVTSLLLMSKISVGVCQIPPDPFPKPIPPKFDLTIDQKYGQLGGENGFLGKAIGGDKQGAKGGKYREFEGGVIYWHPSIGAHEVHGDILAKYKYLGAESSFLGYPTYDELEAPDGGRYSVFEGGVILWTSRNKNRIGPDGAKPKFFAFEVHDDILIKYKELGAYDSKLGYPVTDVLDAGDGRGKFSLFEHGVIYWTQKTHAHEVHGGILGKYEALSVYAGFLGYPTTDELITPDEIGRYNHFEGGSIYWTPSTKAHEVHGEIHKKWASMGWEKSWLKYPTSDEFQIPGTNGRRSIFTGGAIDWYPGKGASPIQHFYDLKAMDWCYSQVGKNITFRAVVANVGTKTVTGPGNLAIGIKISNIHDWKSYEHFADHYEANSNIPSTFKLEPGETTTLKEGCTVPFESVFIYEHLEYLFNIAGEPPTLWVDIQSGKSNNARTFFLNSSEVYVGDPKTPIKGSLILNGKKCLGF